MFTPLNLGLDGQLTPDKPLPAATGLTVGRDGEPASFAVSLDLSLQSQLESGELLPPDGDFLPVAADIELEISAYEVAAEILPVPAPALTQRQVAVAAAVPVLPAGLERSSKNAAGEESVALQGAAARAAETALDAVLPNKAATAESPQIVAASQPAPVADDVAPPIASHLLAAGNKALKGEASIPSPGALAGGDGLTDEAPPQVRLTELTPAGAEPGARPPVGPASPPGGFAELPVYRPADAALPDTFRVPDGAALNAASNTAAAADGDAVSRAVSRPANLLPIGTPVGDAGWNDSLSERVLLMTSNKLGNAEIRLTPAELGPVRVQVTVDDGTASLAFQAGNAATREAIEQALPRLREMLAENGLSMGEASVGDQGVHDGGRETAGDRSLAGDAPSQGAEDTGPEGQSLPASTRLSTALVDTFV
ncbi:MAG: flagellar hook-length control protein FliK [Pseudomonadota bacterium]